MRFLLSILICCLPNVMSAQCADYFGLSESGQTMEMTSFSSSNKLESTQKIQLLKTSPQVSKFKSEMFDKKGKAVTQGVEFDVECKGDMYYIDMQMFANAFLNESTMPKDVKVTVESSMRPIPKSPSIGQKLENATITINMDMGSGMEFKTVVESTNRTITSNTDITCPLGTFPCYVLEETAEISGVMGMKMTFLTKTYINPKIGFIKSETFKKSGKLESYTLRTK